MQKIVFALLLILLFIFVYVYYLTQMDNLIAIQISALTPAQVATFSVLQIQSLTSVQLGALTPDQYKAMTNKAAFSDSQYILMSKETLKGIVGSIPGSVLLLLLSNKVLLISDINTEELVKIGSSITVDQKRMFSADQILQFVENGGMVGVASMSQYTPTQIANVLNLINSRMGFNTTVPAIHQTIIKQVTIAQLNGMTTQELQNIPSRLLPVLQQTQISAIPPSLIIKFTTRQMTWFTPTQMTWFTTAAIGALTPEQIAAIS